MQSAVTVPYALLITVAVVTTGMALATAALSLQRISTRRLLDLSPPSPHTPRSDCPRPGCRIVHPPCGGHHRHDPRPDGPLDILISTLACGYGLINNPKGQHYRH